MTKHVYISSIPDLLKGNLFKGVVTSLARAMNVTRGTVYKYEHDKGMSHHSVRITNYDEFELFVNLSNKPGQA